MSLNVNYNSLYKNGIDTSILKDVSKIILNKKSKISDYNVNKSPIFGTSKNKFCR